MLETRNEIKEIIKGFLLDEVGELALVTLSQDEIEDDVYPEVEEFVTDNGHDYLLENDDEMYRIVDEIIAELQ